MKEYQKQLILERAALQVKCNQLGNFLRTGTYPTQSGKETMPDEERSLMEYQYLVMGEYLDTLNQRIKLTENPD